MTSVTWCDDSWITRRMNEGDSSADIQYHAGPRARSSLLPQPRLRFAALLFLAAVRS
jgi:hypothetical protein